MRFARVKAFARAPSALSAALYGSCLSVSQSVSCGSVLQYQPVYQGILWRTYLTTFTTVLDSTFKTRKLTQCFYKSVKAGPQYTCGTHLVPIPSTKTNKLKEMGEEISTGFNLCINRYIYRVYCLNRMFTQPFR